ncbi:PAS domain-containing protein [Oceanibaculum pacificum]|uniref:PAS domain-containing protein n=1 Tax=Oceanibaculum pacificum TaxID=580166 RepID=A0A154VHV2_9PROT|nr:PAS domain-containing protein [Oceanibaculum pacificum]KZD00886.1 hypothetical protein AUP43_14225 [Oceanibaculum pacificum]
MRLDIDANTTIYDERLKALARSWANLLEAKGAVPSWESLEPRLASSISAMLWLVEAKGTPRRYLYLMMGSHVGIAYDGDMTGRYLDQLVIASALPRVQGYFDQCLEGPCLMYTYGRIYSEATHPAQGERLILPLADSKGTVKRLLGATLHSWTAENAPRGLVSTRQVRTFLPVDGGPSWSESSL